MDMDTAPLKNSSEMEPEKDPLNGEVAVQGEKELYSNDENKERGNWSGKLDFVLSMLGYSVGMGNVWRFSYLCHRNGGGAFLVPYLLTLAVVGVPMFFYETCLSQFTSFGTLHCWNFAPLFKGLGVGMIILSLITAVYLNIILSYSFIYLVTSFTAYLPWTDCEHTWNSLALGVGMIILSLITTVYLNIILSYSFVYLVTSFTAYLPWTDCDHTWNSLGLGVGMMMITFIPAIYFNVILSYTFIYLVSSLTDYLPWTDCNNTWNSPGCSHKLPIVNCSEPDYVHFANATCYNETDFLGITNVSTFENATGIRRFSPSEEYFNTQVLGLSDGLEYFGMLQWKVVVGLVVAWTLVFFCMIKGIKTTGKVVYVTATFPYLILTVLLVRGLMLDGGIDGVKWYITPKWERLADARVWRDGVTQIFYSMGMGWGGLHALASYNKFHHNAFRDAVVSSIGACITSIFSGFVVFSFLGAMSHSMNVGIDDVVTSGPGLAFVVYPEAFTYMPCPTLWSILFFLMLVTLGIDTQFVMLETIITCVVDEFKSLRPKKTLVILAICVAEFILGLPFTSSAGIYLLLLIDNFLSWMSLPIMLLLEAIALGYVYGMERFHNDIRIMLGRKPGVYFIICIKYILPLMIPFVVVYPLVEYSRFTYGKHYTYPIWAEIMGWMCTSIPIIAMVAVSVYIVVNAKGSFGQRIKHLCRPTREWGPYLVEHRKLVDYVPDFVVDPAAHEKIPLTQSV